MGLLSGKTALVAGLANDRSLAYVIAKELEREGAKLVITYQSVALEERVRRLADTLSDPVVLQCDVGEDAEIDALFSTVKSRCGGLDALVHAIAYAEKEDLADAYYTVSRRGFHTALDVGCYSFTALARGAAPLMEARGGGAMLTLSYYGAEKVIPHYNIMGVTKAALEASVRYLAADLGRLNVRVNALSAGPIKTLSAKGVSDFSTMLTHVKEKAPLQRNITADDVGRAGLFLLSDLSSGVTGEILHVDCGYNIIGM